MCEGKPPPEMDFAEDAPMLVMPIDDRVIAAGQIHPQTTTPAAQHAQTPEQAALTKAVSHLTKPGESATLTVTAGGHTSLFGAEVKASGSASISVTYNAPGNYTVALSETQHAGVKVASGDGEEPKPSTSESGTRPAGTPAGIVLGPEFGGNARPPVEPLPPATGVLPVSGVGGITTTPVGVFAQAKPPQEQKGSAVQAQVIPPGPSSVQSTPSLSAESTVDVTSTVTAQFTNTRNPAVAADDAVSAANAFAVMAAQPRAGSFVDNPIMDQINGKSGSVAGVSPATLDLIKQNVTSYGATITGSGSVVAGLKTSFGENSLSKLDLSLQNTQQASISRTVTTPIDNQTPSVAYAVSAQTSTQPTSSIFGTSTNDQSSQQVTFTQTYNLNAKEIADPEGTLTSQGLWLKPNTIQQQLQTTVQLGATLNGPKGSSAGNTLVRTTTTTATLNNPDPRELAGAAQSFQSKPAQPGGSHFTVATQTTTAENNTVGVGGDWPISGSLTISEPV